MTDWSQFFCALPPEARPRWARRMAQLLRRDGGRLVCLEWPLGKPAATGGPPWGVSRGAYVAHLGRPGEEVEYDDVETEDVVPSAALEGGSLPSSSSSSGGLRQLLRVQPGRTHQAGYDEDGRMIDYISVWSHW